MTILAGAYLQQPSDFYSVCTEKDLIQGADDAGGINVADGHVTFNTGTSSDLTPEELAAVVATLNPLIAPVEDLINTYGRKQGYAIPLSPVDASIRQLAARLFWIDLLQRRKKLTSMEAEDRRKAFRDGQLRDIANGTMKLTAAREAATVIPQSAKVYKITSQTRAFSRDTLKGM